MLKKILLSLASVFLIFQSWKLLNIVEKLDIDSWGIWLLIAWVVNLFITGIFAFAGFAFATHKLLPASYYTIDKPMRLQKTYALLGVGFFRKMLLATLWKKKNQRQKYFNGQKNGISNLEEQSMKSEFGHLIPFLLLNFISAYFMMIGLMIMGIFTLLLNLIGNLYPIILQRHHRMRIKRLRNSR